MKSLLTRFARCESGATAIEYALIATLIGIAIIVSATLVGTQLNTIFQSVANALGADAEE